MPFHKQNNKNQKKTTKTIECAGVGDLCGQGYICVPGNTNPPSFICKDCNQTPPLKKGENCVVRKASGCQQICDTGLTCEVHVHGWGPTCG